MFLPLRGYSVHEKSNNGANERSINSDKSYKLSCVRVCNRPNLWNPSLPNLLQVVH